MTHFLNFHVIVKILMLVFSSSYLGFVAPEVFYMPFPPILFIFKATNISFLTWIQEICFTKHTPGISDKVVQCTLL